ncbi:glycosyltransferase [Candidatus Pacearchaeota archaeon]|nr:glycosyltransferase [Candidatus Pacearchaeota archaeon]
MDKEEINSVLESSKVAFLGNFPPCECGIATFTEDLVNAMNKRYNPKLKSRVIALNDYASFYNYGKKVVMEINREDIGDFIEKAKKINKSKDIKLVCIQHEFGIFSGEYGSYIVPFLETLEKPSVVTFHSVLSKPDEKRKRIVKLICSKSSAVIVMANKAIDILNKEYGVERKKIFLIHHGIPTVPFKKADEFKKKLKLDNKIVLSTFGLLSRGKGVEYVIRALPNLIKKYPNLIYLVMGETHPKVRKTEGETYRNKLIKEAEKLGIKEHVKFYNKYMDLKDIISYLLASDIYICSNLDENQITSGTLAYALGCGRAVVSTPFVYAKEVLSNERGVLVEFKNPNSMQKAIDKILSDKNLKSKLENNAYSFSRAMIWQNVASNYLLVFNKVIKLRGELTEKYPPLKLNHLKNLTDNFGCVQFCKNAVPDKNSGYTLDDNARALIVSELYGKIFNPKQSEKLSEIYLKFLEQAQDESGNFRNNFMNENEKTNPYSEDAFGRAILALGYIIEKSKNKNIVENAKKIFDKSYNLISKLGSPRAIAFSLKGLYYYCKKFPDEDKIKKIREMADFLVKIYNENCSEEWQWFEDRITYSNSSLSEALFLAYDITKDKNYLDIAEKSFKFLSGLVFINRCLHPIGENGWCKRNGERAFFDQQPVDASTMTQTCLVAYNITRNKEYYKNAVLSFNWFLGKNHLNQMMYDESTGGCFDGLSAYNINLNQGAESTISYLTARLLLEEAKLEIS